MEIYRKGEKKEMKAQKNGKYKYIGRVEGEKGNQMHAKMGNGKKKREMKKEMGNGEKKWEIKKK